ncbi:MAG: ubiquinone/menaquinone biosynthesis C-methylase UbiE [Enterobacterales bacterium]|jgi:ubiquinone/menaquinone biosynthesis C-methylase UbiE
MTALNKKVIKNIIEPFVQKTYDVSTKEWSELELSMRKMFRWRYIKNILNPFYNEKKVEIVKSSYELNWAVTEMPKVCREPATHYTWNDSYYYMSSFAEKKFHMYLLQQQLTSLGAKKILEVGSGNGVMAIASALGVEDAEVFGIELTDTGVEKANYILQNNDELQKIKDFVPFDVKNDELKVSFESRNACSLPYDDETFDVVYTSLALEQMNSVIEQVLSEIFRVSKKHVVFIEPFSDFNQTKLQKYYTRSRNYFSHTVEDMKKYGFEPVEVISDFPVKMTRGAGLLLAKKISNEKAL